MTTAPFSKTPRSCALLSSWRHDGQDRPDKQTTKFTTPAWCDQLAAVKTRYPLTSITWADRGLRCRPIEVKYFFEVIRWQITSFKWSQVQVYFFQWFIWNMLCLCHYGPSLSRFWFQTDLGRENSASFLTIQAEKTFSYHGHALITLHVQFLYSDWSKFDRWVHAENLCSVLKVVYFDSWRWQSFVSTCDVFNCLFPLDVQNEIQLLSRVFCYPSLVCLLGFW